MIIRMILFCLTLLVLPSHAAEPEVFESLCGDMGSSEDTTLCEKAIVRKTYMEAYAAAYEVFTNVYVGKDVRARVKASATVDLSNVIARCGNDLECQYNRFTHLRDHYRCLTTKNRK